MRPYALFYLYRSRLRVHAVPELLAGLGVAVAVALVFATLVANNSVVGSASQVVHAVVGPANLQLRGRGDDGFNEGLLGHVEALPGVVRAAPVLEQPATLVGPRGKRTPVVLAGTDLSLAVMDGLAHTLPRAVLSAGGLGVSQAAADKLGLAGSKRGPGRVVLELRGSAIPLKVSAVLGARAVGALSQASVAVMPLESLQALAALPDRVSRILVQSAPGQDAAVRKELQALASGELTVAPANQDLTLLRQALRPGEQASDGFAAISVLLGFLFAFNAFLLTIADRRRTIADMRIDGTPRGAIVQMVLFEAVCLGIAASLVGLAAGYGLSVGVFHESASYLSQAFALGSNTVIGARPLIAAFAAGIVATCAASAVLLLDLREGRALDAVYLEHGAAGNSLGKRPQRLFTAAAVGSSCWPLSFMRSRHRSRFSPWSYSQSLRCSWSRLRSRPCWPARKR